MPISIIHPIRIEMRQWQRARLPHVANIMRGGNERHFQQIAAVDQIRSDQIRSDGSRADPFGGATWHMPREDESFAGPLGHCALLSRVPWRGQLAKIEDRAPKTNQVAQGRCTTFDWQRGLSS